MGQDEIGVLLWGIAVGYYAFCFFNRVKRIKPSELIGIGVFLSGSWVTPSGIIGYQASAWVYPLGLILGTVLYASASRTSFGKGITESIDKDE